MPVQVHVGSARLRRKPRKQPRKQLLKSTDVAVPRNVVPGLGGVPVTAFDTARPRGSDATAEYSIKVIFPKLLPGQPGAFPVWLSAFCTNKPFHHALHYAVAVHRDLIANKIATSISTETLAHKAAALKELRLALSRGDFDNPEDRDILLLTVMALMGNHVTEKTLEPGPSVLFHPHMPLANWTSVYGRMDYVETHSKALGDLIDRIGGLEKIQMASTAATIALADLLQSSPWYRKPRFPRCWKYDSEVLRSHRLLHTAAGAPGRGFFVSVPGMLPPHALATFIRLATLDRKLEAWSKDTSSTSDSEFQALGHTRNAVHHDLLSLPHWDELEDRGSISQATYETCRLAAIIYSSSVIMATPSNSRWTVRAAEELLDHLQHIDRKVAADLYLWALLVGGLASFRSELWPAYRKALNAVLEEKPRKSWAKQTIALQQFLWSEMACSDGVALLRQSL